MKLITVEADIRHADLDRAIALFSRQAGEVRAMPGCVHYAIFRKPSDDGIAILQHWRRPEDFEAYRASDGFATLGAELRPLMTAPPVTIVAEVDSL